MVQTDWRCARPCRRSSRCLSDFTVVTGLSGSSSSSGGQEEAEETFLEEKPEEAVEVERRLGERCPIGGDRL